MKNNAIYVVNGFLRSSKKLIRFPCPHCACRLQEDLANSGKTDRCPFCKKAIVIPGIADIEAWGNREQSESHAIKVMDKGVALPDDGIAKFSEIEAESASRDATALKWEKNQKLGLLGITGAPAIDTVRTETKELYQALLALDPKAIVSVDGIEITSPAAKRHPPVDAGEQHISAVLEETTQFATKPLAKAPLFSETPEIRLVNCEDCGKQVSKKASHCPNCGCPVVDKKLKKRKALLQVAKKNSSSNSDPNVLAIGILVSSLILIVIFIMAASPEGRSSTQDDSVLHFKVDAQKQVAAYRNEAKAAEQPSFPQYNLDQSDNRPRTQLTALIELFKLKATIVDLAEAKYRFDISNDQKEHGAIKSINGSEVMLSWRGSKFGTPCKIFKMYHIGFRNYDYNEANRTAEVVFRDDKAYASRYEGKSYGDGIYESVHQVQGEMKLSLYFENNSWAVDKIECRDDALKSLASQLRLLENLSLKKSVNDLCLQATSS